MYRIVSSIVLILSAGIMFSCSGTANTTQKSEGSSGAAEVQKYPSWYPNQQVVSTDSTMAAYATAIGPDSASAVSKAVAWAESGLKSSLSDKLESIRSQAVKQYGSESGLDSSSFLIALREADNAVDDLIKTGHTEVKTVEGFKSYRSFAEVTVPKQKLITEINKQMADYEQTWNTMKKSKAFANF